MIKLIDILLENDEDVKYPKGKYVEITNNNVWRYDLH